MCMHNQYSKQHVHLYVLVLCTRTYLWGVVGDVHAHAHTWNHYIYPPYSAVLAKHMVFEMSARMSANSRSDTKAVLGLTPTVIVLLLMLRHSHLLESFKACYDNPTCQECRDNSACKAHTTIHTYDSEPSDCNHYLKVYLVLTNKLPV